MSKISPPGEPTWTKLIAAAAASSLVTLFVARNFFSSEKKICHQIQTDYGIVDDVFPRVIGQLLGPPLLTENRVRILQNGDQIFPAILDAIRNARSTITMENFLWREGRVANAVANALAERARSGVKVHVLQDAFGCSGLYARAMSTLRDSPVELEIFRAFPFSRINFRTHRKLLIIDGRVGFLGGVCIADEWQGNGLQRGHWRDSHYEVAGPVVAQMQQAFLDNWMQTRTEVLHGAKYFPALSPAGNLRCQAFKSSAGEGADSARLMLLLTIAAARKRICIANAFFLPDNLTIRTLIEACERGVEVEVVAPGPDNDSPLVRLAARSRWKALLEAGVRIWEYQPAMFHCKYLIADDCWCSVGSTNIDHRSLRLNEEANLNIMDRTFAAEHLRIFEEDKSRSREVTLSRWRDRSLSEKVTGRIAGLARMQM